MNSQIELDEYNSFQSLLSRYRRALSLIEESGVRVAGSCRLRVYEQRLAKLIADPRPAVEAELVFASVFDLREIDEVIEIVEYLPKPLDAATLDLLTKLVGGNENPDNAAHATAREAQYELYLGAVFRRTGVHARHGAPDLVTPWQNEDFFLEAKRPTSSKRLDDRLRSAVHQIRKLPRPGIVAISVDQLVRPTGGLLAVESPSQLAPTVNRMILKLILENAALLRGRLIGEPVAAVLWTARVPARITSTGHSSLGTNLHLEILDTETREVEFARWVVRAYLEAQTRSEM